MRPMFFTLVFTLTGTASHAFDSGSTGADGALIATSDQVVVVPASGRLDYTTIMIDAGVTVRFVGDGPVTLLASGDVDIAGTLDVSGLAGTVGAGPLVALGGAPGPGGGWGGSATLVGGLVGLGPGGGGGAFHCAGAGGAGPATRGQDAPPACGARGGEAFVYGYRPYLFGGSGGGGTDGDGGGGGGGVLTLASSGTMTVSGAIQADGGAGLGRSGSGGGGAVRLVATRLEGGGVVSARAGGHCGGAGGTDGDGSGGCGGAGSVRLEADFIARDLFAASEPRAAVGRPRVARLEHPPSLRIVSIDGQAPATLTPGTHPQTRVPVEAAASVTIVVESVDVLPGSGVYVAITLPTRGAPIRVESNAELVGTKALASATIVLALPELMTTGADLANIEAWVPDLLAN